MDNLRVYGHNCILCNKDTQPSQTCSEGYTFSKKNALVWYNRKKKKYTKFSNSERKTEKKKKTVLLAGFFTGDMRVTVDN